MNILLIEPYYMGSHRAFCDGYAQHSQHSVDLLTMPGKNWKQRMRAGSIRLAEKVAELAPDVILASDYLDLATFRGLRKNILSAVPVVSYFHENQLTYPLRDGQVREMEFAHKNISTCMAADCVLFNSHYHRSSFLSACGNVYDDPRVDPRTTVSTIGDKSEVVYVGVNLAEIDKLRDTDHQHSGPLTILWNHRWEYDKCPEVFFDTLERLQANNHDFRLVVAGQSFPRIPPAFQRAQTRLSSKIERFGTIEPRSKYLEVLQQCDVVVSTAIHEFFGISVVEATYAGCTPLLPDRLSYPEIIPSSFHESCLYQDREALYDALASWAQDPGVPRSINCSDAMERFKWERIAPQLDTILENRQTQ